MRTRTGWYTSVKTRRRERYASSYELQRMKALDASPLVKSWTKDHGIRIPYKERKRRRHYIPDFLVVLNDGRKRLEETKGYVFSKMNFARKNLAANSYCLFRGMEFRLIFREDLDVVT